MATQDTVELVEQVLAIDPSASMLEWDGSTWTYGDIRAEIDEIRSHLADLHVAVGTPVATVLPNDPAGLVAMLAVFLQRACLMTISPRSVERELRQVEGGASVVLGPAALVDGVPIAGRASLAARTTGAIEPLDGVAALMATSGTTGEPKRIPISYDTIDDVVSGVRRLASNDRHASLQLRDETSLVCFPYTSLSGMLPQLIAVVSGRRTALLERFDPRTVADAVHRHRMTSLALNPTAMRMLLDAGIDPGMLESVRFVRSGSAPLHAELAAEFEARFDVAVLQSYGQTEVGGEIVGWSAADHRAHGVDKRGSVGRPHPGIELLVVPRGDVPPAAVEEGETGDLWVRGARNVDGWHPMRDLARIDGDGFVWIEGRADGLIVCGGFNVVPAALERVLEQHPGVAEAVVVGRRDDRLGEIPVAIVVLRSGESCTEDELVEHCRAHLEPYQVPRAVVFADHLRKNEVGKPHLPSLRRLAMDPT